MKSFDISFPVTGALHFYDIKASNEQEAIDKCYDLYFSSEDAINEFGEWNIHEDIYENGYIKIPCNKLIIEEICDE